MGDSAERSPGPCLQYEGLGSTAYRLYPSDHGFPQAVSNLLKSMEWADRVLLVAIADLIATEGTN